MDNIFLCELTYQCLCWRRILGDKDLQIWDLKQHYVMIIPAYGQQMGLADCDIAKRKLTFFFPEGRPHQRWREKVTLAKSFAQTLFVYSLCWLDFYASIIALQETCPSVCPVERGRGDLWLNISTGPSLVSPLKEVNIKTQKHGEKLLTLPAATWLQCMGNSFSYVSSNH